MHARLPTICHALVAVAGLCVLAPDSASALTLDVDRWGEPPSNCGISGLESSDSFRRSLDLSRSDVDTDAENDEPPCENLSGDADNRDYNVCFEKAGAPASVLPQLTAKARAERLAERIAGTAGGAEDDSDGPQLVLGPDELRAEGERPASRPVPDPPERRRSCTQEPASCESLPPLPPTLSAEGESPVVHARDVVLDVPTDDRADADEVPAHDPLGPAREHRSPPDKPPRG